jgi:hypothetical protein
MDEKYNLLATVKRTRNEILLLIRADVLNKTL